MHNYHRNTVHALAELIAAMGLDHTERAPARTTSSDGSPTSRRWPSTRSTTSSTPASFSKALPRTGFQGFWDQASAESFRPWSAAEQRARAG